MATTTTSGQWVATFDRDQDLRWSIARAGRTLAAFATDVEFLAWMGGHEDSETLRPFVYDAIAQRDAEAIRAQGGAPETLAAFAPGDATVFVEAGVDDGPGWQALCAIPASELDTRRMREADAREALRTYHSHNPETGGWLRLRIDDADDDQLFVSAPYFFLADGEWAGQILADVADGIAGVRVGGRSLMVGDDQLVVFERMDEHGMTEPGYDATTFVGGEQISTTCLDTPDALRDFAARWLDEQGLS